MQGSCLRAIESHHPQRLAQVPRELWIRWMSDAAGQPSPPLENVCGDRRTRREGPAGQDSDHLTARHDRNEQVGVASVLAGDRCALLARAGKVPLVVSVSFMSEAMSTSKRMMLGRHRMNG